MQRQDPCWATEVPSQDDTEGGVSGMPKCTVEPPRGIVASSGKLQGRRVPTWEIICVNLRSSVPPLLHSPPARRQLVSQTVTIIVIPRPCWPHYCHHILLCNLLKISMWIYSCIYKSVLIRTSQDHNLWLFDRVKPRHHGIASGQLTTC